MPAERVIWKFVLPVEDEFDLQLPVGAEVVHVAAQHGRPCLWAICSLDAPRGPSRFFTRGTGHPLPEHGAYLGSYMLEEGAFVGHLFREEMF